MEGNLVSHPISIDNLQAIWSLCFSPNGKKLACSTYNDIRVYDVECGALILGLLEGHNCILWSHDSNKLFSASREKEIRCWNSETGEQIGQPWIGHTNWIRSLSLLSNGLVLASVSLDNTVRFWDAASGNQVGQHVQRINAPPAVCFSPFSESLVLWGGDGSIYLWQGPWMDFLLVKPCAAATFTRASPLALTVSQI